MHMITQIRAILFASVVVGLTHAYAADIIVDNPAAELNGTWTTSSFKPNAFSGSYLYRASGGSGTNWVKFRAAIPTADEYDVYYWLPDGAGDRATNAQFLVWHGGTSTTITVNETPVPGGSWIKLGTWAMTTSTSGNGVVQITDQGDGSFVVADAVRFVTAAPAGDYTVRLDVPRQTIWGLGVEIQSDSIGSGNNGLPDSTTTSVPHDLTPSERTRLATDLVGRGYGFRYIRLALGLYLRGLTPDKKNIIGRWSTQMSELASLISVSGADGVNAEYWSPAPFWKSNADYIGGTLKAFDPTTLNDFGNSVVADLNYLQANGVPVKMFGLQNEPIYSTNYSSCVYSDTNYVSTFNVVAGKVRASFPTVHIHVNSLDGQSRSAVRNGVNINYVDAWTWHKIGTDSDDQIAGQASYNANTLGKLVYNNEFEYLDNTTSDVRCLNTAQSIMNWLCFENSPTWFWLHALKPTYNAEAQGYALGYWRPADDTDFSKYPNIQAGHFDYELRNWRAIVGFLEKMPWDSVRYQVDEASTRYDQRILAFRQGGAAGKLVVVVTNRGPSNYTYNISSGLSGATFRGYRYSPTDYAVDLGTKTGGAINVTVPSLKIEFWVQQ
jgi:O-glycosyl hydrolase